MSHMILFALRICSHDLYVHQFENILCGSEGEGFMFIDVFDMIRYIHTTNTHNTIRSTLQLHCEKQIGIVKLAPNEIDTYCVGVYEIHAFSLNAT